MWDDGTLWKGAREGKLLLRACADCDALCHPPLPMCPGCQSLAWKTLAASGQAELLAWFVATHPTQPGIAPRTVAVVRLDEGVNFVANIVDSPVEAFYEGMRLELCFGSADGVPLPHFRSAAASAGVA
jgi:uncharacterized protein